jgi:hypothetical protein
MASKTYEVEITTLVGATDGDGFIDNKKIEQYMAEDDFAADVAASLAKERGNSRYEMMIGMLGMMGNLYVTSVTSDADANTDATTFAFTLVSEHGEDCLAAEGLVGAAALKRVIARSLLTNRIESGDYFDPTATASENDAGLTTNVARFGTRIEKIDVGSLAANLAAAEAAITVTAI